jgi:hypothetical protein
MSARFDIRLAICFALSVSCQRPGAPSPQAAAPQAAAPQAAAPQAAAPAPTAVLDRMDSRTAVPLLPMMANHQKENMRDHLRAVQEIVLALTTDDFPAVERATGRIGYSESMGKMCQHMGAGAPGFTEQALKFHHTADTIATAARKRDRAGVLGALSATMQTCVACHATFKQQVVDDATWSALAGPMGHPRGH